MARRRNFATPGGISLERIDELLAMDRARAAGEEPPGTQRPPAPIVPAASEQLEITPDTPVSIVRRLIYPELPTIRRLVDTMGELAIRHFTSMFSTGDSSSVEIPHVNRVGVRVLSWRFIDAARQAHPHLADMDTSDLAETILANSNVSAEMQPRRAKSAMTVRLDSLTRRVLLQIGNPKFDAEDHRLRAVLRDLSGGSRHIPRHYPNVVLMTAIGASPHYGLPQDFVNQARPYIPPGSNLVFGPPEVIPEGQVIINAASILQGQNGT